jgi:quinoprotein glucose dehydrogenase
MANQLPPPRLALLTLRILAGLVGITGVWFVVGGGMLASRGGAAMYYLASGCLMIVAAYFLWKRAMAGAWTFGALFVLTVVWSAWEAGLDYWGWVPRLGLVTVFAFVLALLLPYLRGGTSKRRSFVLAGAMGAIFVAAFVLAFVPTHVIQADGWPSEPLTASVDHGTIQPDGDWAAYGRDKEGTRYSPLKQLTAANVGKLERAWVYRTGDLPPKDKVNKWAAETTPLKVGDALYVCSATNNLMRLEAATGKEVWVYKSGVPYEAVPYTAACRGVTYYESRTVPPGQVCHTRIIEATLDERLIAVDTETGKPCEGFGAQGQVNLLKGMGNTVPGFVAEPSPPPIVNGVIVTNQEVLDGQRRWAPSGVIRGYSADSGQFLWAWDVNRPDQRGEPAEGEFYSRGTPNSWTFMTGDDELGLVYVPTGNSAADYFSAMRSEQENEVSSAVVALDAKTGEKRWVFQVVHKDVWDYDMGSQVTLMDFPNPDGGVPIPAMIVPSKRGQTFILDRRTGKSLTRVVERPAPASEIPDDVRATTQPWSIDMPRLGFPDLKEEDMWGMTPFDQLWCRLQFRRAHYVGEFTPPTLVRPWIEYPGYNGGSDWGGVAYDGKTGVLIANWNNTPMLNQLLTRAEADRRNLKSIDDPSRSHEAKGGAEGPGPMADTPYGVQVAPFLMPLTSMLCNKPPYGMITAIDMHTRKVIWQRPLGTARANGPFGLPTGLPINIGTPNNGGPVITAGGLVFVAAATDNLLRAIDITTGKTVWSDVLPAGGQATPMTYEVNGRQFVVIVAGGHHFMRTPPGDYVVAYALPTNH